MSSVVVTGSGPSLTITVYVEAATPRLCEVEGCESRHYAKGLCNKHWSAAWHAAHREEAKAAMAAWYAVHREEEKAAKAAWRAAHPEEAKAVSAARRAAHPEKLRANKARRRARKLGNVTEPYDRADIFERDEWVCQLCNLPIDPELRYPDPGFGTIDHVTPLALGGSDEPTNVVAAHLVCNLRKGTHLEPLPDNVVDFVTEFDPDLPIITFA